MEKRKLYNYIFVILVSIAVLATHKAIASIQIQEFKIPTKDKVTVLTGQLDQPDNSDKEKYPAVIMMPGTGRFNRDALFGPKTSEKSFLFKYLGQLLNERGIATVRYDYRGISFTEKPVIDSNIRQTVTPENQREDFLQVYNWAKSHPKIDEKNLIVLGLSEGSFHVSVLASEARINPKGIVFIGGIGESPASGFRYRLIDRNANLVWDRDYNQDGIVTNSELDKGGNLLVGYSPQMFYSPNGKWSSKEELLDYLTQGYELLKSNTLKQPEKQLADGWNTNSWWRMWFTDKRIVAELLTKYKGRIVIHNGSIDSQTNPLREFPEYESRKHLYAIPPKLVKHENLGHALGVDPTLGPMDEEAATAVVDDIEKIIQETTQSSR